MKTIPSQFLIIIALFVMNLVSLSKVEAFSCSHFTCNDKSTTNTCSATAVIGTGIFDKDKHTCTNNGSGFNSKGQLDQCWYLCSDGTGYGCKCDQD